MYLFFQTYDNTKISAGLTNIGLNEGIKIKLKDMNKNNEIILITLSEIKKKVSEILKNFSSNDFDNYTDIGISKYLLKIDLSNVSNETLKNERLKIIIGGNVNLKYLGYLPYEPNINSNEIKIEYKKYNYGVKTGEIFENYKKTIKLLEEEFNVEMHPDAKGYYIETIFTNEVETIVRFDKEKLQNQICSYDKKEDVYFLGNNHEEGKIEGEGKTIIIKDNKNINIYKGKIHKNKICCQLLNLNEQSDKAILKIPNITIFDEKSVIESKFHKHKLIYASVKSSWKCNSCLKHFDENTYSFGCRECNFDLCMKCLFDPNIQKNFQNSFKENLNSKINSYVSSHEERLKRLLEIHESIVRYFPRPNWHGPYINQVSIVDALASIGYPYDKNYRSQIGIRNNIPGIPFSPEYNTHMLNLMKQGKLIIP